MQQDYIYGQLDNNLIDINTLEYIKLLKCTTDNEPIQGLNIGDYYLATKFIASDKITYTDLSAISEKDESIILNLQQEILNRKEEVTKLQNTINSEAERTNNMINQLNQNAHSQLVTLNNNLIQAVDTINAAIEAERKIRDDADTALKNSLDTTNKDFSDKLEAESKRVDSMVDQLNNNIKNIVDQLNSNITQIVNSINQSLSDEVQNRIDADNALQLGLDTEIKNRKEAITSEENRVNNIVNQLNSNITTITNQLNKNMADGFNTINGGIETFKQETADSFAKKDKEIETLTTDLKREVDNRVSDVKYLTDRADKVTEDLNNEVNRSTNKDIELDSKIDAETVRATNAENTLDGKISTLSAGLATEISDRKEAIEAEINARKEAIIAEANDRKAADTKLEEADKLNDQKITTVANNLQIETNRASQAEENLHNELITKVGEEATARLNADNALSQRIENLEGKTTRLYYGEGTLSAPTATDIQSFVNGLEVDPPYFPPYNGIAVVVKLTDENTYHIWHYYVNLSTWKDDGVDLVNTFTNEVRGIIQGSTQVGYVMAENGLGKVSGFDELKARVDNINTTSSSLATLVYQDLGEIVD